MSDPDSVADVLLIEIVHKTQCIINFISTLARLSSGLNPAVLVLSI